MREAVLMCMLFCIVSDCVVCVVLCRVLGSAFEGDPLASVNALSIATSAPAPTEIQLP